MTQRYREIERQDQWCNLVDIEGETRREGKPNREKVVIEKPYFHSLTTRVRHLAIAWAEGMREEVVGRTDNRLNMR